MINFLSFKNPLFFPKLNGRGAEQDVSVPSAARMAKKRSACPGGAGEGVYKTNMEHGTVIEIRDGKALVETGVSSSCEGCLAGHSCLMSADGAKRRLWMENDGGAGVGDEVAFYIAGMAVVASAVVVYLVPAALLIGGIILGAEAGTMLGFTGDLPLMGGGAAGLMLSFLFSRAASAMMKKKKVAEPRMVDITRRGGSINCG